MLMLTAHEGDIPEVTALNAGIDEFLTKPISPHVLLAHINVLLRRYKNPGLIEIAVRDLDIIINKRTVNLQGSRIELTCSKFELLWRLASNVGSIVTCENLFQATRGKDYDGLNR